MCSNGARANILKHKVFIFALATIDADLAIDAARNGRNWTKRSMTFVPCFALHMSGGSRVLCWMSR